MKIEGLERWGDRVEPLELGNGNVIYYVNFGGLDLPVGIFLKGEGRLEAYGQVDGALAAALNQCLVTGRRVRLWYGDRQTGESWNEEFDVLGRVGRSGGGRVREPILLLNSRSSGGPAILVGSLVRVDDVAARETLWSVANFHVDEMEIVFCDRGDGLNYGVKSGGKVLARFKDEVRARRWAAFMKGERYAK